tara:strand:- start:114 stop:422 length:309 start_codon:yes stop_codon:yes gene_type:complete
MNDCYHSNNDYNPCIYLNILFIKDFSKRGAVMPQQSRYQTADFEKIMNQVLSTLEEHDADRDLSLMVLGNAITHIFNTQVKPADRAAMAEKFAGVLVKSINQ